MKKMWVTTRAEARFNIHIHGAYEFLDGGFFRTVRRRERRAAPAVVRVL